MAEGRPSFEDITCQECGAEMARVAAYEIDNRIASGRYVRAEKLRKGKNSQGDNNLDTYDFGVFGICSKCQRNAELQAERAGGKNAADAQMARIREYVAQARKERPDYSLEQAVAVTIAWEFMPYHEADRGFRAYLLGEGAPKNPDVDAAALAFMAALPEGSE